MTTTGKNTVLSSLFLLLGLAITWETFNYSANSAVFLRGLSVTLSFMALAYLVMNLLRLRGTAAASDEAATTTSSGWLARHGYALMIFALVIGYVVLLQIVGFLVSTALFGYFTQVAIARRHRMLYVIYAVLMSITIYFIFFNLLGVAVPDSVVSLDQALKFL